MYLDGVRKREELLGARLLDLLPLAGLGLAARLQLRQEALVLGGQYVYATRLIHGLIRFICFLSCHGAPSCATLMIRLC